MSKKVLFDMAVRHTNKKRNVIVLIAIMLTSILFSTISIVGIGIYNSFQNYTFLQTNNTAHGMIMYIDDAKFQRLTNTKQVKEVGYEKILSTDVIFQNNLLNNTMLVYKDESAAEFTFCKLTDGNLPKEENEIATSREFLERLGVKPEIGSIITLSYKIKDNIYEQNFMVTGIWNENSLSEMNMFLVSKEFADGTNIECTYVEDANMAGVVHAYIMFEDDKDIEKKMGELVQEVELQQEYYNINWAYLGNSLSQNGIVIFCFGILVLIVGFIGYLLISNIYQITVSKDVKYYGLLKLIGCTKKQIRYMLMVEVLLVTVVGTFFGSIFGVLIGNQIIPMILAITNIIGMQVKVNYMVLMFSALFVLFTVSFSMLKPYKTVCGLSPVEAFKY